MRSALVLLAAAACGRGPDPAGRSRIDLACSPQVGNALRFDCTVELEQPAVLELTLSEEGREDRIWTVEAGTRHDFVVSGLAPQTRHTLAVGGSGLRTEELGLISGSLPAEIPAVSVTGEGTVPYVLVGDGTMVFVFDREGRVVWFEDSEPDGDEPHRGLVAAYDWTGDGVLVQITSIVRHVGVDGAERLRLERGVDYERPLHHDIFWADGRIFTMNAGPRDTDNGLFTYDGFYVLDEDGVVYEWDLYDHWDQNPERHGWANAMWDGVFPGAEDVAHANGIFEAADGTILVSFRTFRQVWALGGVGHADAGEVRWVLDGSGAGDFQIDAPAGVLDDFRMQHHPRLDGNRLTLMDNRSGELARTLALELDHGAGTATVVESHDLGLRCPIQSSNYPLESGNVLAGCTTEHVVMEFAGGSAPDVPPIWSASLDSEQPWMIRAVPIEEPPPGW